MIQQFADTQTFLNWTLPVILSVSLSFLLIYGPWLLIPSGIALIIRVFFLVKKPSQKAKIFAITTLASGILLAAIAFLMHSTDRL